MQTQGGERFAAFSSSLGLLDPVAIHRVNPVEPSESRNSTTVMGLCLTQVWGDGFGKQRNVVSLDKLAKATQRVCHAREALGVTDRPIGVYLTLYRGA